MIQAYADYTYTGKTNWKTPVCFDAEPYFDQNFEAFNALSLEHEEAYNLADEVGKDCIRWTADNRPTPELVKLAFWVDKGGDAKVLVIFSMARKWKSQSIARMARAAVDHLLGDFEMGDEP